jgi:hypothetical protein
VRDARRELARERGAYVDLHQAAEAIAALPLEGLETEGALRAARKWATPPPAGQVRVVAVHVLAVLDGCATAVTARASAEMVAARDADEARIRRIGELMALAEPEVLRRAPDAAARPGTLFVVAAPGDAVLGRLGAEQAVAREARARGAYVGLHETATVIAALPLEAGDRERPACSAQVGHAAARWPRACGCRA